MERMHADELEIGDELVRGLVDTQFPEWAELGLRRVEPVGTDHAVFQLGQELCVRLARRNGPTKAGSREMEWLPKLAPRLPLEIPVPIAQGRPGENYPWFWNIQRWVDGDYVPMDSVDAVRAARDLAHFVEALRQIDPTDAPRGRGVPLAERDEAFRHFLPSFPGDRKAVEEEWRRALDAPPWQGPPVWHHGDLDARNWLVRDGRISGMIDWEAMGVGDPACDVMVAWKLHSSEARDAFRQALPVDDATWARARGWVVAQAVAILAYYSPANNPTLYSEAESWLKIVLSPGPCSAGTEPGRRPSSRT